MTEKRLKVFKNLGARRDTAQMPMPCLMNAKRKLGVMDGWELKCPVFLNLAAENVIVSVTVVLAP